MIWLPAFLGACFPSELARVMTQCSEGSQWSPLTPREPQRRGVWVWLHEICHVRRTARFFFCCTLFWVWQLATKGSQSLAVSSPSLQNKVSVLWCNSVHGPTKCMTRRICIVKCISQSVCTKGKRSVLPVFKLCFVGQLSESELSIVHPVKTGADGGFISHSLSHHFNGGRIRRDLQSHPQEKQVYYKVIFKGKTLMFNLTANNHLVSNDYILDSRNGSANRTEHRLSDGNSCHLLGTVEASDVRGTAAISTCSGLVRCHSVL